MTPQQLFRYHRAKLWYDYHKTHPDYTYRQLAKELGATHETISINIRSMKKHLETGEPFSIGIYTPNKREPEESPKNKADAMWAKLNLNFANGSEYA